jgi:cytoskeletal protein CcmA (bactofilin family)
MNLHSYVAKTSCFTQKLHLEGQVIGPGPGTHLKVDRKALFMGDIMNCGESI